MATLKSLRLIWVALYEALLQRTEHVEQHAWATLDAQRSKDLATFQRRAECSGLQFATVEMPQLARDVLTSFTTGQLVVTARFKKNGRSNLPAFLNGYFSLIYRPDGSLREAVSAKYVKVLLQLLGVFYKLSGTSTPEKEHEVARRFIENQERLGAIKDEFHPDVRDVLVRARTLIRHVLDDVDPLARDPRHGSGATADKQQSKDKYNQLPKLSERLLKVFPLEYFFATPEDAWILDQCAALPDNIHSAKVCFVPKDSRGPRLISMEQATSQYAQQGIMSTLYKHIESHPLTSGEVNFSDQSINQLMASVASFTGKATIDLKDASDSVLWTLVQYLFPKRIVAALHAVRSDLTIMPDGRVVELHCAFPMGAATCFPVMGLTLWALVKACLATKTRFESVYVYGDDIIAPSDMVGDISSLFSSLGILVNTQKTFCAGPFRESCGSDWYDGYDVSVVRFREELARDPKSLMSTAGFITQLYEHYGLGVATSVLDVIESELGTVFPNQVYGHPYSLNIQEMGTGRNNFLASKRRWNSNLHYYELRLKSCRSITSDSGYCGTGEYHRWYCTGGESFVAGLYTSRRRVAPSYGWYEE